MSGEGPKRPDPAPQPANEGDPNLVELTVNNSTDADICRLHVREDALNDAYGWSTNKLAQQGNSKPIKAGTTVQFKISTNKPFSKPDLHALDCSDGTVMRVYDKPEFPSTAGATWTLARADEGTIAAVQEARGIKKSVHPLARKDAPTSTGGTIEIKLENKCSNTVDYCHVGTGKSPKSLNGGASQSITVNDGDTITQRSGTDCGQAIYTVSSSSNGQSVVLCK